MYFFTSDEHFLHISIIPYLKRPFSSIEEMTKILIEKHNEVVGKKDIVVHAGDFTLLKNKQIVSDIVKRLKGQHIFLKGSHDYWLPKSAPTRWEKMIESTYIVVDHYAMRVWPRAHYGAIQLFGHSHNSLKPLDNQLDIGVDSNNFYPYSYDDVILKIKENHG